MIPNGIEIPNPEILGFANPAGSGSRRALLYNIANTTGETRAAQLTHGKRPQYKAHIYNLVDNVLTQGNCARSRKEAR
jgi:hypothetical protein